MVDMSAHVPAFAVPREFAVKLATLDEILDVGNDGKQIAEAILTGLHAHTCDSDYKRVAYLIFTKAFKTFQAAQTLCRCGFGSDALSLCGTLFENVVDLLYMGRAPVQRPRRYIQYEQVEKYHQVRKLLARKRLPKGRRKIYREYETSLYPQVKTVLKFFPPKKKGWSQKSLFERAREVKADVAYQESYWIFCGHKHTLPMAAVGLTILDASGQLDMTTGPNIKGVYHAAEQSSDLFLKLCKVFQETFGLSMLAKIQKCCDELHQVSSSLIASHPDICE
jgi:hypothetical protein